MVGDTIALLNKAYELTLSTDCPSSTRMRQELTTSIGPRGMVGGQVADLLGKPVDSDLPNGESRRSDFEDMKLLKAVSLFRLSLIFGGLIADASKEVLQLLEQYSIAFGTALQAWDDLHDLSEDAQRSSIRGGSRHALELMETFTAAQATHKLEVLRQSVARAQTIADLIADMKVSGLLKQLAETFLMALPETTACQRPSRARAFR